MTPTASVSRVETAERQALRRRVHGMLKWFNEERWDKCYSLVDPKLRERGKVNMQEYADSLAAFKATYGEVRPYVVRINLHLGTSMKRPSKTRDRRPFAYTYIFWQDDENAFHLFRERWVKHDNRWFTRVVGLVPNVTKKGHVS